jgi:hypothetical protein
LDATLLDATLLDATLLDATLLDATLLSVPFQFPATSDPSKSEYLLSFAGFSGLDASLHYTLTTLSGRKGNLTLSLRLGATSFGVEMSYKSR